MKKMVMILLSVLLFGAPYGGLLAEDDITDAVVEEEVVVEDSVDEVDAYEYDEYDDSEEFIYEDEDDVVVELEDDFHDDEDVVEEVDVVEPIVEEEPVAAPVAEPVADVATTPVSSITPKMMWQFIEDELLLAPGYASAFLSPVKGFAAVGGVWAYSKTPDSWIKWVKEKGWKSEKFSGFAHHMMLAIGAIAGYALTGWAIDTILYGFALNSFLKNYPAINRDHTPEALRGYFDSEYGKYVAGGMRYIIGRTGKVVKFVKMAVKMNKKGIVLTMLAE